MKDKLFLKAIRWMDQRGYREIKANTEAFEQPAPFSNVNDHNISNTTIVNI